MIIFRKTDVTGFVGNKTLSKPDQNDKYIKTCRQSCSLCLGQ